jgi:hypothetical protein
MCRCRRSQQHEGKSASVVARRVGDDSVAQFVSSRRGLCVRGHKLRQRWGQEEAAPFRMGQVFKCGSTAMRSGQRSSTCRVSTATGPCWAISQGISRPRTIDRNDLPAPNELEPGRLRARHLWCIGGARVTCCWILGESFSSQVAWELLAQQALLGSAKGFACEGLILVGGFVRHPWPWGVRWAHRASCRVPTCF